jgi:hypothetical protein
MVLLAAAVIALGVQVSPSSAGGGKEEVPGAPPSHLMGPAIFGEITLTDLDHNLSATLNFVGQCQGKPIEYNNLNWQIFDQIQDLQEKCTLCDGTEENYFEGSYWNIEGTAIDDCSVMPYQYQVLTTVTKFQKIDLNNDGTFDQIKAQGIFLFEVTR